MLLLSLSSICLMYCPFITFPLQLFSLSSLFCCLNSFGCVEFSLGTVLLILIALIKGSMWCFTYHRRLFPSPFTQIFHFVNPFPPSILDTDNLSTSLLKCSSWVIAMTCLVFLFISSSCLLVHFIIPAPYLIKETAHVFIVKILFLPLILLFMINFVLNILS